YTLGFDTSVRTVAEIVERSRTPAGSHHWVQVVEVMGRHAGHLAFWSALAGGAYLTLIPEHAFDFDRVKALLDERLAPHPSGRRVPRYAAIVAAEGATPVGGKEITVDAQTDEFGHVRLGGVGAWLAERIRDETVHDARAVALGHPQRGGPPSPTDRHMGWLFGVAAVEAVVPRAWGKMVSARGLAPACAFSLVALAPARRRRPPQFGRCSAVLRHRAVCRQAAGPRHLTAPVRRVSPYTDASLRAEARETRPWSEAQPSEPERRAEARRRGNKDERHADDS